MSPTRVTRPLAWGLLLVSLAAAAQENVVSRALHDEMQRSMQRLQLEQLQKPYFISYLVTDEEVTRVSATLGSVLASTRNRVRSLTVSVRVGDYALDSSNFLGPQGMAMQLAGGSTALPLDDDYQELRRQIWLATDRAYKAALENFAGKRAALESRNRGTNVPDFTKVAPFVLTDLAPLAGMDLESATGLTRETSALFRQAPWVMSSDVQLLQVNRLQTYLNSEGSEYTVRAPRITLRVWAETEAADGRPLADFVVVFARGTQDLPAASLLSSRIRGLQEELKQLQAAPIAERYEGPVLFEGAAAGELFATRFAANLPAAPPMMAGGFLQLGAAMSPSASLLSRKVGLRVLPAFLDVVDDPTLTRADEGLLLGGYKVDEEGVAGRRTIVVQHGVLKTLLTSRAPVEGLDATTANLRERGVVPSNLLVSSQKSATREQLRKQLLEMAQSEGEGYGIVIRRLLGDAATLAYRVYPDGHEELLRNGSLTELNLASLKNIVAVSSDREVYTRVAPPRGSALQNLLATLGQNLSGGEGPPISCVVPSLLLTDVTVDKPQGESPKPVLIPSPLTGGR